MPAPDIQKDDRPWPIGRFATPQGPYRNWITDLRISYPYGQHMSHSPRYRRRRLIVPLLVAVLCAGVLFYPTSASASPPDCGDILFVGVNGSGQDPDRGMGAEVRAAYDAIKLQAPSREITPYVLPYEAAPVTTLLKPRKGLAEYFASLIGGATNLTTFVFDRTRACPGETLILAGYSQGAMVIHRVLQAVGTIVTDKIAGAILIADGDKVPFDNVTQYGSASNSTSGIGQSFSELSHSNPAKFGNHLTGKVHSICTQSDLVCDYSLASVGHYQVGIRIHLRYTRTALIARAARALATSVASAIMVKDIAPGAASPSPISLTRVGATLFFLTTTGDHGKTLWKSDGTEAGTIPIKTLSTQENSDSAYLADVGGALFIATEGGIWRSDGSEAGTVFVAPVVAGEVVNVGGTLFMSGFRGSQSGLWKSDGTAAGTVFLAGIQADTLTNVNGTLFFAGYDDAYGRELWRSDGTVDGTVRVLDLYPGSASANPSHFAVIGDTLFFHADDGTFTNAGATAGLWRTGGTAGNTLKLMSGWAESLANVGGTLFFAGYIFDPSGEFFVNMGLWKSDGTPEGTVFIKNLSSVPGEFGDVIGPIFDLDGTAVFAGNESSNADSPTGIELWKSDGTASGTILVKDIANGNANSFPDSFTRLGGMVYFRADDAVHGREIWKSDGTAAGTVLAADIHPDAQVHLEMGFTPVNNKLFFVAEDALHGYELWRVLDGR